MKINKLELDALNERELLDTKGSIACGENGVCGCGCKYENQGGSSYVDNGLANSKIGYNPGLNVAQWLPDITILP